MPPNVKVCINGFVLSTLLFDCTNNTSDQEGFLYGSITRNVRREISDHSMSNTQEDILISICSSVPSGSFLSFYNNVGEIKRDDLEYNLGERAENIVGWYRFRRYSAMFPSVREQSTHRHLRELFASWNRLVDTSYFVFGILSSSNLPNYATHSYDYGFFIQRRDGTFKDLPLTILNLGDTRNSYRAGSMALPFMNSSSFNSVLSSSWNFDTFFDTENQIHEFHQRLRAKLDSLQEELAASDAVNASLEDDIKRISNEMQALLATQERLASAAADAAAATAAKKSEFAEMNNEKLKENEVAENSMKEANVNNEKETEVDEREIAVVASEMVSKISEMEMLDVNEKNSEASDVVEACKSTVAASVDDKTVDNKEYDSFDSEVDPRRAKESEPMDYNEVTESSCLKEKTVNSPGLKRASVFPFEDDRSTKKACPDKYFENEEYLSDKSMTKSAEEATSTVKLEDTALSTCHEKGDLSKGDLPSGVSICMTEEPKIPSPASNVEIGISDAGLQNFESTALAGESLSSSDELLDMKESDAKEEAHSLVSGAKSSDISETSKSLSDSDICCKTEVLAAGRCESAPAGFLTHAVGSVEEKSIMDESTSKSSSSNRSSSKVNPPFIIYASKKSENESSVSTESPLHMNDSKPEESVTVKIVDENSQSSSSQDQKDEQKNDVPQGSVKKVE